MNLVKYFNTNYYNIILHIVVVILCFQVFLLSMKLKKINEQYASVTETIEIGDNLYFDEILSYNDSPRIDNLNQQIIFVFTTSCPTCKVNIGNWNSIDSITQINGLKRPIGICLNSKEEINAFINQAKPSFHIYFVKDIKKFQSLNKLWIVPQTVINNQQGKIIKILTGKLNKIEILEIVKSISK